MQHVTAKLGVVLAAGVLALGLVGCGGSATSGASGTGTGDNTSIHTDLQKAETQEFETVTFGTYEQDSNAANGAEPIEWYVLDEQDGKKLLISKYVLDALPYDTWGEGYTWYLTNPRPVSDTTWMTSSLRVWLNGTFLQTAFTADEQAKIQSYTSSDSVNFGTSTAETSPNAAMHVETDVTDKVFLLSNWEARSLFWNDAARMALPTAYALAQGVYVNTDSAALQETVGYSPWWTRTVGYYAGYAAVVLESGEVHGDGYRQDGNYQDGFEHGTDLVSELGGNFGVRPAIWVDASALN